jgi:4-hydroxy-tetrahydrodipicolinate synthase
MNKITGLKGSIVALVTPFEESGAIDYVSLKKLIQFHLENKTDGIVVCGTTGEAATMSQQEYGEIIKFVVDEVAGQIPVIAGSGANSTAHTLENSKMALESGADALLIVTPYYNKPNPRGMYQHFAFLAERLDCPIVLYNVPSRTGINLSAAATLELAAKFDNIVAIKEASGDLVQLMEILKNRPDGFQVYSGEDVLSMAMISLGIEGCISVAANIIPKQFSQLMHAALDGDFESARQIQFKYFDLMNLNFVESNPIPVKTALHLMGMIKNEFRLPLAPISCESNLEKLRKELIQLKLIAG